MYHDGRAHGETPWASGREWVLNTYSYATLLRVECPRKSGTIDHHQQTRLLHMKADSGRPWIWQLTGVDSLLAMCGYLPAGTEKPSSFGKHPQKGT